MTTFDRQIGQRLRDLRERRALTQRELASLVRVSRSLVTRWEQGSRPLPMVKVIDLARALRVEPGALLAGA